MREYRTLGKTYKVSWVEIHKKFTFPKVLSVFHWTVFPNSTDFHKLLMRPQYSLGYHGNLAMESAVIPYLVGVHKKSRTSLADEVSQAASWCSVTSEFKWEGLHLYRRRRRTFLSLRKAASQQWQLTSWVIGREEENVSRAKSAGHKKIL